VDPLRIVTVMPELIVQDVSVNPFGLLILEEIVVLTETGEEMITVFVSSIAVSVARMERTSSSSNWIKTSVGGTQQQPPTHNQAFHYG
jgi:hypothetical protein